MKIKFTSLIAAIFIATVSKGQLYFENKTNEPVEVCIAMFYDSNTSKYWGSEGWFRVDPGDKKEVSTAIGFNDNIYYYAHSVTSKKEYTGENSLLVHPINKFFIKNCDKEYVKKEHPEYVYKKFRHIDMHEKLLQTKFTIELSF